MPILRTCQCANARHRRGRAGERVVLHDGAGVHELERARGELRVRGDLRAEVRERRVRRREREPEPGGGIIACTGGCGGGGAHRSRFHWTVYSILEARAPTMPARARTRRARTSGPASTGMFTPVSELVSFGRTEDTRATSEAGRAAVTFWRSAAQSTIGGGTRAPHVRCYWHVRRAAVRRVGVVRAHARRLRTRRLGRPRRAHGPRARRAPPRALRAAHAPRACAAPALVGRPTLMRACRT
jgi:hypothetical protein